jgi:hypothetical protein
MTETRRKTERAEQGAGILRYERTIVTTPWHEKVPVNINGINFQTW